MTQSRIIGIIIAFAVLIFAGFNALFTVNETQVSLVLQFGEPKRVIRAPGLHLKVPFIQNVIYYDSRVLSFNPPVEQVILADQKRLDVDSFVKYKIINPLEFYQAAKTEEVFRQRLSPILNSALRNALGRVSLLEVLSKQRATIMDEINTVVSEGTKRFGVDILDVRIKRADLPPETSEAIYERMRSERKREAFLFRAEGEKQSLEIKANADREKVVIISKANEQAKMLQGDGDKQALETVGRVASQNPEFYAFVKTLEAYDKSLNDDQTTFFLSPNSEFMKYFKRKKN